jgi:hypothetical protein
MALGTAITEHHDLPTWQAAIISIVGAAVILLVLVGCGKLLI